MNRFPQANQAAPPRRPLRVLCIDDDELILESMKDCLAYFEHQVAVASGGKRGLELFRIAHLKSEPYDVVVTDMMMPELNGCVVARMIKAESPDTPVVLMTGVKEGGSTSKSVDAVVYKPPLMQELSDLLLRLGRRS